MAKSGFEQQQFEQTKALIRDAVLDIITNDLKVIVDSKDMGMDNEVTVSPWLDGKKISSDTVAVEK